MPVVLGKFCPWNRSLKKGRSLSCILPLFFLWCDHAIKEAPPPTALQIMKQSPQCESTFCSEVVYIQQHLKRILEIQFMLLICAPLKDFKQSLLVTMCIFSCCTRSMWLFSSLDTKRLHMHQKTWRGFGKDHECFVAWFRHFKLEVNVSYVLSNLTPCPLGTSLLCKLNLLLSHSPSAQVIWNKLRCLNITSVTRRLLTQFTNLLFLVITFDLTHFAVCYPRCRTDKAAFVSTACNKLLFSPVNC